MVEQPQPSRIRVQANSTSRSGELKYGTMPRTPQTPGTPGVNAAQDAYFTELLAHPLERLAKEPELLREEQAQLRRQTQESAVSHYKAFLATAECAAAAHQEAGRALAQLDALAAELPQLAAAATGFSTGAASLLAKRARNKALQSAQGPLSEVLEVPALMDTCVRNGHFDEALDLRAFINTLAYAHADVPVVAALRAEADAAAAGMLEVLLGRLRGPVQVTECLRIIGYLRRLGVFDEQELRAQFLSCREAWLNGLVEDIESGGAYETLRRLTDVHRLQLFDVVMQYRSVFSDEEPQPQEASGQNRYAAPQSAAADGGLLYAWAERRIFLYLQALRQLLPQVMQGSDLAAALDNCMYAGLALSRVGLDFRPALPPLFESCILSVFTQAVAAAVETFAASLEAHRWLLPSAASRARRPAPQEDGKEAGPPYALMEAPPLALFANGIAAALNELRSCSLLVLQGPVASVIQEALGGLMAAMTQYGETRTLSDSERPLFVSAAKMATKVLAPYVSSSLQRVYPAASPLDVASAAAPLNALLTSWAPPPPQQQSNIPPRQPQRATVPPQQPAAQEQQPPPPEQQRRQQQQEARSA